MNSFQFIWRRLPVRCICLFVCLFVQGHPTTVFCEISVRRSKYCLEFSFAWGQLVNFQMNVPFMYNFQSLSNKLPTIFWSLIFHNLRPWLHCFSWGKNLKFLDILKGDRERNQKNSLFCKTLNCTQHFWKNNTEALVISKRLKFP